MVRTTWIGRGGGRSAARFGQERANANPRCTVVKRPEASAKIRSDSEPPEGAGIFPNRFVTFPTPRVKIRRLGQFPKPVRKLPDAPGKDPEARAISRSLGIFPEAP